MGLDTVELVMEVEETFGIAISNEEAPEIITVGDLHHCVLKKLEGRFSARCRTSAAFYQLRRTLMGEFGLPRPSVRLESSLDQLIPWQNRREHWRRLGDTLQLSLPRLVRPRRVSRVVLVGSARIALASVALWLPLFQFQFAELLLMVLVIWAGAAALGLLLTTPFARNVSKDCHNVRDVVHMLSRKSVGESAGPVSDWNPNEVWEMVLGVVAVQLGVEKAELRPETRFVEDLGAD